MRAFVAPDAPGCAVAINRDGTPAYRGAFGLAELEHRVPITGSTIFEAGSVSKQFTAAAVLLLAARGTLSLDDPIQRWFPELPEYQAPITVRHLMLHTSGLRDWGSVIGLTGWPRWTASYTHADALAIIARQRGLNHAPGAAFSYTNTGYNLLAMLVERAARVPFTTFTERELFTPLGMTSTSWRDDYTRIVPGRAQAYSPSEAGWRLDMPFEHVHGNGGLLTTVDDLLRWNQALVEGRIGSPDVSVAMQTSGRFNNGNPVNYGGGLYLTPIRGVPSVNHGGATAGYRATLAWFPAERVSVALLCNRGDANPGALAATLLEGTVPFAPMPTPPTGATPVPFVLDSARYRDYVGTWWSDEAGGSLRIELRDGRLIAERRPGDATPLRPTATDRFAGPGNSTIRFERDSTGLTGRLWVSVGRALNVPYQKRDEAAR
jgi:CubicO group peptidase (beta-lactamase class C family)